MDLSNIKNAHADEARRLYGRVKSILDGAKAAGREPTVEERAEMGALMPKARAASDRALADHMKSVGEHLGFSSGPTDGDGRTLDGTGQPTLPHLHTGGRKASVPSLRAPSWASAVKSYLGAVGAKDFLSPSGGVTVPAPVDAVVRDPSAALTLLDALPSQPLEGTDTYAFLRETTRNDAAAPVALGAVKPESEIEVEKVEGRAQTIAHLSPPVPRQHLADSNLLDDYIGTTLVEGVEVEVQRQLLYGNGTAPNLEGLDAVSGVLETSPVDDSVLRTIRRGLRTLESANIPTDGAVLALSPTAWERAETEADQQGGFLLGQPGDAIARRLWGSDVVTTTAVNAGEAWLIDRASVRAYWRQTATVEWTEAAVTEIDEEITSLFARNLVQFRAECRVGFAVRRPRGIVKIVLPTES